MSAAAHPPAIFLMGPTASGKTGVAVELVSQLSLEIISVDSAMVYRGMDIGTAKPSPELLRRAPHHLIDIRDPAEPYSAAEFRVDALAAMEDITRRGCIPLLTGGTLLYFRALEKGLSELPAADPEVRARLEAEARQVGWEKLHAQLARIDPAAARRIHANDPQRIQRALEVFEISGQPLSAFHEQGRAGPLPYRLLKLALGINDRERLHARIEQRFRTMLAAGFIEEVAKLIESKEIDAALPAMRAVGYRQAWLYLEGRVTYDEMVNQAIVATRQYAKRQMTWLRGEQGLEWFAAEAPAFADKIRQRVERWLGEK